MAPNPLFYVTILATLCIRGLIESDASNNNDRWERGSDRWWRRRWPWTWLKVHSVQQRWRRTRGTDRSWPWAGPWRCVVADHWRRTCVHGPSVDRASLGAPVRTGGQRCRRPTTDWTTTESHWTQSETPPPADPADQAPLHHTNFGLSPFFIVPFKYGLRPLFRWTLQLLVHLEKSTLSSNGCNF